MAREEAHPTHPTLADRTGPIPWAVASGLLYAAAFPPLDLRPLGWVALTPLFYWWLGTSRPSPARGAWSGLVAGASGAMAGVWWLGVPFTTRYGFQAAHAASFVLGVSLFIGGFYAATGAAVGWTRSRRGPSTWLWLPWLWVAGEWLRAHLWMGVPWLMLGHTQVSTDLYPALAPLGGAGLVSWLLAASAAALARGISSRSPGPALLALGLQVAWLVPRPDTAPRRLLTVGVVQPAIPQAEKWDKGRFAEHMRTLYELTGDALDRGADLVVWPETALTTRFDQRALRPFLPLLRNHRAALLVGAPWMTEDGRVHNSAVLVDQYGQVVARHDKQILLPFGEYYPGWLGLVPGLLDLLRGHMGEVEFSPGQPHQPLTWLGVRFGVTICYEATYPSLVTRAADRGASFLVNMTNDAWFEGTPGMAQHLSMAMAAAMEARVPMVRAANTGISAITSWDGRLIASLGPGERGVMVAALPAGPGPGNPRWFGPLTVMLAALALGWPRRGTGPSTT